MISIQLRPKYPLEQYVVAFEFPGTLTQQPVVTTELLTGDDPDFAAFAGWLFTTENVVSVLLSGGVAGCVYEITCDGVVDDEIFTRSGVVTVKETVALIPPGFSNPTTPGMPAPVFPFSRAVSSPLYPASFSDSISFGFAPVSGELVDLFIRSDMEADSVTFTFIPVGGDIFIPLPSTVDPDALDFMFIPVSGFIQPPAEGAIDPDEVEFTFIPVSGNIQTTPVGEISPDEVEFTFIPVGGTIS